MSPSLSALELTLQRLGRLLALPTVVRRVTVLDPESGGGEPMAHEVVLQVGHGQKRTGVGL